MPFSSYFDFQGALSWDRRRPRLLCQLKALLWRRVQARTPAVPEERALKSDVATKGTRHSSRSATNGSTLVARRAGM